MKQILWSNLPQNFGLIFYSSSKYVKQVIMPPFWFTTEFNGCDVKPRTRTRGFSKINHWYHGNTYIWDRISADQMLRQMRADCSRNNAGDTKVSLFAWHGKHCCSTKNVSDNCYFFLFWTPLVSTTLLSLRTGHVCGRNNVSATFIVKPMLLLLLLLLLLIKIVTISNSNWTEWSTIQGVIARVISKSD